MSEAELIPIGAALAVLIAVVAGLGPLAAAWDGIVSLYLRDMIPRLELLNISLQRFYLALRIWGVLMVLVGIVIGGLLFMPLLAVAIIVPMIAAPRIWMSIQVSRRRTLLRDQMVSACVALANSVRAGLTLEQALETVTEDTPKPLAGEFRRINRDRRGNVPLGEALTAAKDRLDIDTFSIFAVSLVTCLEQGGKMTEMLERISENTSETQRLERKVQAETAAGRRVVWILAIFPLIFLAVMGLLHPSGATLMFTTWIGQGLLLVAIVLVSITLIWSRKILTIEF